MSKEHVHEEIKCSKCGRSGVRIVRFTTGTSGDEYICEKCVKQE